MSEYLRPQSPIYSKEKDAYIYPLTTTDQVIMPDGRRMNSIIATTSSDNGKFLRVVNGVPTWSTVPNAEEATT